MAEQKKKVAEFFGGQEVIIPDELVAWVSDHEIGRARNAIADGHWDEQDALIYLRNLALDRQDEYLAAVSERKDVGFA